jgi:ethanolamine utilization protein EutP (predicted NTPase)
VYDCHIAEHREIDMAQSYKATAKQNPGRKAWLVEFRHPLRTDANNKPGKKIRKGLGTEDTQEAHRLVQQLTQLLADQSLWSVGAQAEAAKRYDGKVVEIFYGEIAPRTGLPLDLRDKLLPLPGHAQGYARIALMGVPGAGKTTLVRQLIGTHPETERFPSTSVNRTTTFPTEVAMREDGQYEAVVTFMSEHETRFEIEESLSSAIVEAVDGDTKKVARALLEKSDMRFRLKYLLGDFVQGSDAEVDPYDDEESVETKDPDAGSGLAAEEAAQNQKTLAGYVGRVVDLAKRLKAELEAVQGQIETMPAEDRSAALDLIEEQAATSDDFLELVSDILDELRTKFAHVTGGQFEKTTTGWPNAWHIKAKAAERESFLKSVRFFSGISYQSWGKLLTPLVNGLRIVGPFKPSWAEEASRLVLVDTEGLGHKANATADLPEQVLTLLHDADVVLLVDSAKNGMTNFAAGKALEGVVNTGHTRKLAVVFTHMDAVKGDNLKGQAKLDHVFGGLRNVVENQLAKNVSAEAARYLLDHLGKSTFYVGRIDELDPKPAKPELLKLLAHLSSAQPPLFQPVAFPEYSHDNLVLAIQEAARDFRQQWQGTLGLAAHADSKPKAWQTIKALSRRYAEGWDDGFVLQPTSNLVAALSSAVSRFLETPIGWSGSPTPEQKRETIDRIKTAVTKQLPKLSTRRLRELPQPVWHEAYALRGAGSTFDRRMRIEGIYERWVPIPESRGHRLVYEFLNEVKEVVIGAVVAVEQEVRAVDAAGDAAP